MSQAPPTGEGNGVELETLLLAALLLRLEDLLLDVDDLLSPEEREGREADRDLSL